MNGIKSPTNRAINRSFKIYLRMVDSKRENDLAEKYDQLAT